MLIFLCLLVAPLFIAGEANELHRIVNGELAKEGQFPYIVGLAVESEIPFVDPKWCGGSIISNEWVLTAAHCVGLRPRRVLIFYGSILTKNAQKQLVSGDKITKHPNYRVIFHNNYRYDIALIQTRPVKFNDNIQSIPLPSAWKDKRLIQSGQSVISAGWGAKVRQGTVADRLNWVKMEITDESVCAVYGNGLERVLCVNPDQNKSVCSGDSGGPLVPADENKLIGIVSFGSSEACDNGLPNVYTNVISYLDWIESVSGVKP